MPGPLPSLRSKTLSTKKPTTRAMNTTKVLTTPWIRVKVTMSPLATWAISWPSTASTSSRFMFCNRPVDTATSAEFLKAPVAKAFGSPSYTATSGMATPARSARLRTVFTSHSSVELAGWSITRAPVDHLAIGLLISSEMIDPVKPTTRENTSRAPTLMPCALTARPTPSTLRTMDSTSITARLVARNSTMRFIQVSADRCGHGARIPVFIFKTQGEDRGCGPDFKLEPVVPDRFQAARQRRQQGKIGPRFARRMKIRAARGEKTIAAGQFGVDGVLVGRVAARDDFDGGAAQLLEFVEQGAFGHGREFVASGVGNHGLAAGGLDPAHRLFQRSPAVRHIARLAFAEKFTEHLGQGVAGAAFDQVAGKMGARYQVGIADIFQGAFVGARVAGLVQLDGDLAPACVAPAAGGLQARQQGGIGFVDLQADDVHRLVGPGDGNFHAGHEAHAHFRGRGARGDDPAHFVVVGQAPDVDPGLARIVRDGGRGEDAVGNIGVAVQINIEHGAIVRAWPEKWPTQARYRKASIRRASCSGWSWCSMWPASASISERTLFRWLRRRSTSARAWAFGPIQSHILVCSASTHSTGAVMAVQQASTSSMRYRMGPGFLWAGSPRISHSPASFWADQWGARKAARSSDRRGLVFCKRAATAAREG